MQKDTRNLTVARDHLASAYDEVTLAQGQPERSIAEAAVRRALDHLNLVTRRLETERSRIVKGEVAQLLEELYTTSQAAWQGTHNVLNGWENGADLALNEVRQQLIQACEMVEKLCEALGAEAVHA